MSLKFFKTRIMWELQYINKDEIKKGQGDGPVTCNLLLQKPTAAHLLKVDILYVIN